MDRWGYLEGHFLTEEEPIDNHYQNWLGSLPNDEFLRAVDFEMRGSVDVNYLAELFKGKGLLMYFFNQGECAIIVEALRNYVEDESLSRHSNLMNTVMNNAALEDISECWDCSKVPLARKLGGLSEVNASDLLDRAVRFWKTGPHETVEGGLRASGLLPPK